MLLVALVGQAQDGHFLPGQLAVLRTGNGAVDPQLKQAPVFIDQFDPAAVNTAPTYTVAIPTNGPDTLFFNAHAATEGVLTRSANHRLLVFAGYGGVNLLEKKGTPSLLEIPRGFATVDAAGTVHTFLYKAHDLSEKVNPRGAATDGTNNFWAAGNAGGTLYYNSTNGAGTLQFEPFQNSRAAKIIGDVLYITLNGPDGIATDEPAGIYRFVDKAGSLLPLPRQKDAVIDLVVPATAPYTKIVGLDLNPDKNIAYLSDTVAGIQKYTRTGNAWKLAYNIAIPQNIPAPLNHATGCFGLVVDFSGVAPVIFATTTEGYGRTVNSNRVVRIVDTSSAAVVTTVAQCPSVSMAYRGIDFTPEFGNSSASKP